MSPGSVIKVVAMNDLDIFPRISSNSLRGTSDVGTYTWGMSCSTFFDQSLFGLKLIKVYDARYLTWWIYYILFKGLTSSNIAYDHRTAGNLWQMCHEPQCYKLPIMMAIPGQGRGIIRSQPMGGARCVIPDGPRVAVEGYYPPQHTDFISTIGPHQGSWRHNHTRANSSLMRALREPETKITICR